jgi:hypothetical protein
MDLAGAIEYLARAEGRRVRPISDVAELDELDAELGLGPGRGVPAVEVYREGGGGGCGGGGGGRLRARGVLRCAAHDNAARLPFMVDWFERRVLPLVEPEAAADVVGSWRLELHDSYSYLPGRERYREVLSFGRTEGLGGGHARRVALLPDPYHIAGFDGLLAAARRGQRVPWELREPTLFFAGTTTGDRDPARNARLRACAWSAALGRRDVARMLITNVAQMSVAAACAAWPRLPEALVPPVGVDEHWRYRYQVNIVGNTACWSRLPMVLSGGALLVHVRHADAMWYYPLLREGEHYVGADSVEGEALLRARAACLADDAGCRRIAAAGARLAERLFAPATAAAYAAQLLQEAGAAGRA